MNKEIESSLSELARNCKACAGSGKPAAVAGNFAANDRAAATGATNTHKKVLGIRMPDLRRLAKKCARHMDARAVYDYMRDADKDIYEHVLLAGLLIKYADLSDMERIGLTRAYLKHVDTASLIEPCIDKIDCTDAMLWWSFAMHCLASPREYTARYGAILLDSGLLGPGVATA